MKITSVSKDVDLEPFYIASGIVKMMQLLW